MAIGSILGLPRLPIDQLLDIHRPLWRHHSPGGVVGDENDRPLIRVRDQVFGHTAGATEYRYEAVAVDRFRGGALVADVAATAKTLVAGHHLDGSHGAARQQ